MRTAAPLTALLSTTGACLPPTAAFSFSDGQLPVAGQHDVAVGAGAGTAFTSGEEGGIEPSPNPFVFGAAAWTIGLTDRVALASTAGMSGQVGEGASNLPVLHLQAEVQARVTPDDSALDLVVLGGVDGAVVFTEPDAWLYSGGHVGALVSGKVQDNVRLYAAARLAVVVDDVSLEPFSEDVGLKVWVWQPLTLGASVVVSPEITMGMEAIGLFPAWGGPVGDPVGLTPGGIGGGLWLRGSVPPR